MINTEDYIMRIKEEMNDDDGSAFHRDKLMRIPESQREFSLVPVKQLLMSFNQWKITSHVRRRKTILPTDKQETRRR